MQEGIKVITPDGYIGYYRNHSEHIVWLSQLPSSIKMFPYPIVSSKELENWKTTNEKTNIQEKYGIQESKRII